MFFIKTLRELKELRIKVKQYEEALADNNEELKLYEREMAKIERDEKITHYHVNAKMLAKDLLDRSAQKDIVVNRQTITYCLVSYAELKRIANSHIK